MARHQNADPELISRYLDGEVSPVEFEAAEQMLADDPDFAAEISAVRGFGVLMRQDAQRAAATIDFSRFADAVLDAAEAQPRRLSFWERVEAFFQERLGKASEYLLPGAVVAAAAAAAFVIARPQPTDTANGPRNELVITKVDSESNWMSQTIDDEGTTILWIDDTEEE